MTAEVLFVLPRQGVAVSNGGCPVFPDHRQEALIHLHVAGLRSLRLNDFREGNIISDTIVGNGDKVNSRDMVKFFGFSDEEKALQKLAQVHREHLFIFEINPSNGASCLMFSTSVTLTS